MFRRLRIWAAILLPFACVSASAQQLEQGVKAAFIYNFTKYVTWPASAFSGAQEPIIIGIVGLDSLGGALDSAVAGKTVDGRRLVVRHVAWSDAAECHVLFVPAAEAGNRKLSQLTSRPVLTIGESEGFAKRSGIIGLFLDSNRVRFEINAGAARRAELTISSKLLSLGRIVG